MVFSAPLSASQRPSGPFVRDARLQVSLCIRVKTFYNVPALFFMVARAIFILIRVAIGIRARLRMNRRRPSSCQLGCGRALDPRWIFFLVAVGVNARQCSHKGFACVRLWYILRIIFKSAPSRKCVTTRAGFVYIDARSCYCVELQRKRIYAVYIYIEQEDSKGATEESHIADNEG